MAKLSLPLIKVKGTIPVPEVDKGVFMPGHDVANVLSDAFDDGEEDEDVVKDGQKHLKGERESDYSKMVGNFVVLCMRHMQMKV